jgi:DNA-binding transcriptional LysR family regulator
MEAYMQKVPSRSREEGFEVDRKSNQPNQAVGWSNWKFRVREDQGWAEIDASVAILPEDTIRGEVAKATLVVAPLDGKYFRPLAIIYRKTKVLSPAMKSFIELLGKPL